MVSILTEGILHRYGIVICIIRGTRGVIFRIQEQHLSFTMVISNKIRYHIYVTHLAGFKSNKSAVIFRQYAVIDNTIPFDIVIAKSIIPHCR